jgi:hypothetical protein
MSYGVTEQGFIRKTRSEILRDQKERALSLLGPETDLSESSEDGLRILMQTDFLDEVWQKIEDVFYSNFLETSYGVSLDRVVAEGGVERAKPKRSIVLLTFEGVVDSPIEIGIIAQTPQGIQFITIDSGVILGDGFGSVFAQAIQFGIIGNVDANTITEINTPKPGIQSVTNLEPASQGRIRETDPELISRYKERGTSGGSSAVQIQNLLKNEQSIVTAKVYENATKLEDSDGRPPSSMEAVVEGGSPEQIGNLFVKNWPGGIESVGEESVTIIDNENIPRTYKFSRPTDVPIFVKIIIDKSEKWIEGSEQVVKTNCIKIVGGTDTIGPVSTIYSGKGLGESLASWELEAAQLGVDEFKTDKVAGIKTINIEIGISEPPEETFVIATGRQRLKLITSNIEVEFV